MIHTSRLLEKYRKEVGKLKEELSLPNILAVPRIEKIVVNTGIGKLLQQQPKDLDKFIDILKKITGQRPVLRPARKAVSAFKVREGQVVGLSVTLRGRRMYDFFDKLVNAALPRSRDFRGLSRSGFDGKGNYSLGLREHLIFPEMVTEESQVGNLGLEISIVTNSRSNEHAYQLLKKLGFPFKD